jgi:hypothetical protein
MHLAELIDQDGRSEDDRVKRRRPVGPEKIPIFAQNFGDGREVPGRLWAGNARAEILITLPPYRAAS